MHRCSEIDQTPVPLHRRRHERWSPHCFNTTPQARGAHARQVRIELQYYCIAISQSDSPESPAVYESVASAGSMAALRDSDRLILEKKRANTVTPLHAFRECHHGCCSSNNSTPRLCGCP